MFDVTLYASFSKPDNSLRLPASGGENFPALVVEPCGIITPRVSFNQGRAWNPSAYNYAYIGTCGRYYWIREWTFSAGIWYADMSVDPLASHRDAILSREEYVVRSSSNYDLDIIDGKYPIKQDPTIVSQSVKLYAADTLADGTYVLGIANGFSGSTGGITYYCATQDEMSSLFEYMYGSTDWFNGPAIEDISEDLLKCLFNPAQYLVSLMWFPFDKEDVANGGYGRPVGAGYWDLGTTMSSPVGKIEKEVRLGRPHHPQASRGNYLNFAPYMSMRVYVAGFGSVDVNLEKYKDATPILKIQVDVVTGQGQLCIYPSNGDIGSGQVLNGQIGVPIALTSMLSDITGAASTVVGGIAGGAGAGASGGWGGAIAGAIAGAAGSIVSAAQQLSPDVTVAGGNGNMSIYQNPITETVTYKTIADEDLLHFGRPLMQKVTLSSLSGYCQVEHFDTNIPCTVTEQQQIKSYMEGGVYIE